MRKFVQACVDILELEKPYKIVYRFLKKDRAAEYICWFKGKRSKIVLHEIRISQRKGSGRSIKALIAHEFVHAWQAENGLMDMHGEPFQTMAVFLSQELARMGFSAKGLIYDANVDK